MTIKQLREEQDLSQTQMAIKIGVSFQAYRNWETGVCPPSRRSKRKLNKTMRYDWDKENAQGGDGNGMD